MEVSSFYITPRMKQLFDECVEKRNYKPFYDHYKRNLEELSAKLKAVSLTKNTIFKCFSDNFMDCFKYLLNHHRRLCEDASLTPFYQRVVWAITNKNWAPFYTDYRDIADYVIKTARKQDAIHIYVVENDNNYTSFYSRDCEVAKNKFLENNENTQIYKSKNNKVGIVCTFNYATHTLSSSEVGSSERGNEIQIFDKSRNSYTMTVHGETVAHFTCSQSSRPCGVGTSSASRSVKINRSLSRNVHQERTETSSCCLSQNAQTDSYGNERSLNSSQKHSILFKCNYCLNTSNNGNKYQGKPYNGQSSTQSNSHHRRNESSHPSQAPQFDSNHSDDTYSNAYKISCLCDSFLKLPESIVRSQVKHNKQSLAQSYDQNRNGCSTTRDISPTRSSQECKQQPSAYTNVDKIASSQDKLKTQSLNMYDRSRYESIVPERSERDQNKSVHESCRSERLSAKIDPSKHSEQLNNEASDRQSYHIGEEERRFLDEVYKNSKYFKSSEIPGVQRIEGLHHVAAFVTVPTEDNKSLKRGVNETDQYFVPPKHDSRMPPSSLTSNVLLDNQKNLEEAPIDSCHSDFLNSWSIVSVPHANVDTLKNFEFNNTSRKSSEEVDIRDAPVPETKLPQTLMLGDLWSDLDKPEPLQKPALRSDSSVDQGLEDWKRYAEDIKQQTTNAFIDTDPIEPTISENEYSEDEEQNTTMNRDFERKFQEQTERNQEELRRKREERAARRREHEEELSKMRQESKQKYLIFFNCLGLKLRFEEQEHNWKGWIQGCKQCVSKLLELFNQFVSEVRRTYKGLKHMSTEDKADFQTEISFLLNDIMNTYNSLEDIFEQLTNLESRFEDVLFIKVLKKCIADSATRLLAAYEAAGELSEHANQDNFQNLQNTFDGLTPSLIYSTTELRRICKEHSYSDNYENVQFPQIPSQKSFSFVSLDV